MTSSRFPPSISFPSALLRRLFSRPPEPVRYLFAPRPSCRSNCEPAHNTPPSHSAIRPSRLHSPRERSVRPSFSHNRPFGKSRGVQYVLLADDALCPLDRTPEYSADASILDRSGRGNPELPAPPRPASFPSRLRARGRHEFERFRPYRLRSLRSARLSRG